MSRDCGSVSFDRRHTRAATTSTVEGNVDRFIDDDCTTDARCGAAWRKDHA